MEASSTAVKTAVAEGVAVEVMAAGVTASDDHIIVGAVVAIVWAGIGAGVAAIVVWAAVAIVVALEIGGASAAGEQGEGGERGGGQEDAQGFAGENGKARGEHRSAVRCDAEAGFALEGEPAGGGELCVKDADGVAAHEAAVLNEGPVGDLVGIDGDAGAEFEAFDFLRPVIDVAVEAIAAEGDAGEPKVLDESALAEGFLDLEIVLAGGRVLKSLDEDADGAACLMDGALDAAVVEIDGEDLGLGAGAEILAGEGVIGACGGGCGGDEGAGEDGGEKGLHGIGY